MAVDVHQRAKGFAELYVIDGASHVDLYDKKEYLDVAVDKLADFYTANLT